MPRSVFTPAYAVLLEVLVKTRKRAGVGQVELAARLGRAQSFVSRVETGERRLDVIEFFALARALGVDPKEMFSDVERELPNEIAI